MHIPSNVIRFLAETSGSAINIIPIAQKVRDMTIYPVLMILISVTERVFMTYISPRLLSRCFLLIAGV